MTKIKILILFFAMSATAYANDFIKAKLIYSNGTLLECYANFINDPYQKTISYKLTLESKKQEVKSTELKKIVFYENTDSAEFELITAYRILGSKPSDPCWMINLVSGYTKLYCIYSAGYVHNKGILSTGAIKWESMPDSYMFVCIRPDEPYATIISHVEKGGLTINANTGFKKQAAKYFSDYPELAAKIDNREYTYKEIVQVVEFYNTWKAKQK
jgi:hypothetical protein